jgi:outer membrane protein, multidrug efflux system
MSEPRHPVRRLVLTTLPALAVFLAGCMLGPDYTRPRIDTPAGYRFEFSEVRDAANTRWWQAFGDPSLDDLITQGLAHNGDVMVAAANVEAAAAALMQTRSALFPQVGYSGQGARQRLSEDTGMGRLAASANPADNYEVLANASWEIDLWGRIRRQTEAARANLLGQVEARRGVVLSLVATVANAYIQLLGYDAQLAMARQTQTAYGESLKLFEAQFKYGQVSEMAVAQAKSQYETASVQIPILERQIAQTEDALSTLVGRNPGPIPRGRTLETLIPPPIPGGLPSELLDRRPDIMQAEQQLIAANAQIGAARALYFPTISLTGFLGSESTQLSQLFTGPARTWAYVGSVTGPIFTAGAVSGQVAQAEAGQKAALANYQQTIRNAFADVSNALIGRQKLVSEVATREKLVKALSDYSRLANLQYNAGYVPYSTVLQADQQLFPAELDLADSQAAALSAVVTLYAALGGGWVDEAARMAPQPQRGRNPFSPAIPSGPATAPPQPTSEGEQGSL